MVSSATALESSSKFTHPPSAEHHVGTPLEKLTRREAQLEFLDATVRTIEGEKLCPCSLLLN